MLLWVAASTKSVFANNPLLRPHTPIKSLLMACEYQFCLVLLGNRVDRLGVQWPYSWPGAGHTAGDRKKKKDLKTLIHKSRII